MRYYFEDSKLLQNIDRIVDSKVGIIKNVYEQSKEGSAPNFFRFAADCCDARGLNLNHVDPNFNNAGGASIYREKALLKSIGEGIERYSASIYFPQELELCSYRDANFECVHPSQFTLYSDAQYSLKDFPYKKFTEETIVRWTSGINLKSGQKIAVPAAFVYLPYVFYLGDNEYPICQVVSTGLACHDTFEMAATSALLEVVERDAFMIMWQRMVSPPQIDLNSIDSLNKNRLERFWQAGYKVYVFNITNDIGIPSVLAVLEGQTSESVPIGFAASSSLTFENAIASSLEELAHTERYLHKLLITDELLQGKNVEDIILNQKDHLLYWVNAVNKPEANFLFKSMEIQNLEDIELPKPKGEQEALSLIVDALAQAGATPIIKDVTSSDVASLGIYVVRAIIPELHPLTFGYKYRAMGGKRLWNVPEKIGYQFIGSSDNPYPHPYP